MKIAQAPKMCCFVVLFSAMELIVQQKWNTQREQQTMKMAFYVITSVIEWNICFGVIISIHQTVEEVGKESHYVNQRFAEMFHFCYRRSIERVREIVLNIYLSLLFFSFRKFVFIPKMKVQFVVWKMPFVLLSSRNFLLGYRIQSPVRVRFN